MTIQNVYLHKKGSDSYEWWGGGTQRARVPSRRFVLNNDKIIF